MFSQTIRVFNDCSSVSIAMKLASVFPLSGLVLPGEDFGVIEPNSHKDIRFRVFLPSEFPNSSQNMFFEAGKVKKCVSLDDVTGVKEIRLLDRGFEVFAVICVEGNCLQRIRFVWMLKDFWKICSEKTRNLNKTLFSRQPDYDVNQEEDQKYPLLLPLLNSGIQYS